MLGVAPPPPPMHVFVRAAEPPSALPSGVLLFVFHFFSFRSLNARVEELDGQLTAGEKPTVRFWSEKENRRTDHTGEGLWDGVAACHPPSKWIQPPNFATFWRCSPGTQTTATPKNKQPLTGCHEGISLNQRRNSQEKRHSQYKFIPECRHPWGRCSKVVYIWGFTPDVCASVCLRG